MRGRRALREGTSDLMLDVKRLIRKPSWRDAICNKSLVPDKVIIKTPLVDFEYEIYKRLCG
jgi:hypothetical protein